LFAGNATGKKIEEKNMSIMLRLVAFTLLLAATVLLLDGSFRGSVE
jgi:hypothetical protein